MEWIQWTIITWLIIPVLIIPPSTRAIKSNENSDPYPDSSVFPSQRPLLNYRTRVLGLRYGEPFSNSQQFQQESPANPNLSSNYRRRVPYNNNNNYKTDEYEETNDGIIGVVTEPIPHQIEASTSRIPSLPASLRRKFAYQIATTPNPPEIQPSEPKPKVTKPRRRKVKRPPKIKATTTKVFDDDLGGENPPETSTKNSSSGSGDKNLALEIGSNDGKYALINQFFEDSNDPNNKNKKPPGILSYSTSDDFGHDNHDTLGNLEENDIWLSEGHLLVLKGGEFDSSSRVKWKPIDDYVRDRSKPPLRIPLDTNNPPPFPVFVNKSGPPVFLGPIPPFALPYPPPGYGGNETFDPSRFPPPGMIPLFPNGTIPNFFGPPPPGGFGFGNHNQSLPPFPLGGPPGRPGGLYGDGGPPNNGYGGGYGGGGVNNGQPRPVTQNGKPGPGFPAFLPPPPGFNGTRLPPPPFFPFGPPGGQGQPPPGFNPNFTGPGGPGPFPFLPPLVLNPNDNETDDPSIFLPPPYDFDYYEDNSTHVPPGPFAPGLVVPPPQEFYTVYNRTSPEPTTITTTPSPSTISNKELRPQRPNAKRPKFPMTNPPDDSLEETLPVTSPLPIIPISFPNNNKKRLKQPRPGKSYKYSNEKTSSEVDENSGEKSRQRPVYPVKIVSQRPKTTTTTTTTPTPLNYVYVRGQLKTLAEIAAEEAAEDYEDGPPTPRPPFDELGYPTRDLGHDDGGGNVEEYGGYGYDKSQEEAGPSPTPPKTAYVNSHTPKYDPNYESDPYRKNPTRPSPTPTYVISNNPNANRNSGEYQGSKRRGNSNSGSGRNSNRIRVTPSSNPNNNHNHNNNNILVPQLIQNNNDHNNHNNNPPPNKIVNEQGQVLYYPSTLQQYPNNPNNNNDEENVNNNQNHLGIVPTIYTPSHQHQHHQPQNYQNPTNQPQQPIYNNVLLNHQIHPTQQSYSQQQLTNSGFRPLLGLPQYQHHQQHYQQPEQHQQQFQQPEQQKQFQHQQNPNPYHQRQRGGSRVIFPDQISHNGLQQQQQPQIYSTPSAPSPTPQGYYSPLSQFHQPIPTQGQFVPNGFYPGSAAGFPGGTYQAQYFQPNLQNPQQYLQQQQYQQQQPQNLNQYAIQQAQQQQQHQQQQIPLHRDILVNYREPLPSYNTESESVTTRTVPNPTLLQKAGPSPAGIYGTSLPAAEGLTQPIQPTSFYSFQRGGPGGFSYKIRL